MKTAKIPILPLQASGHEALGGASPVAINVVADGTGSVARRPGIAATPRYTGAALASPVTGLWHSASDRLLAWSGKTVGAYSVYSVAPSTAGLLASFTGSSRPVILETEAIVAWADGRRPNKMVLATSRIESLGGNAPQASHLAVNSLRLLSNDVVDKTHVNYTAPSSGTSYEGHESWNEGNTPLGSSSYFSAEANSDPVRAVASNSNEVFVWKDSVSSSFAPDTSTNLVFVPITSREIGISAPHSVIPDDSTFGWLDNRRRVVLSDLRGVEVLSEPIQGTLDAMADVADCWGFRYQHAHVDALVWVFPTDGRAFAYQRGVGWAQWMAADGGPFPLTAYHDIRSTREHLVGLDDGRIGDLQTGVESDFGEAIGAKVITGYINRDTDHMKQCASVRLAMRRGESTSPEATIGISWRDDTGDWQGPIHVGTGLSGDREIVKEVRGLGTYRRRQWQFTFHGPNALALAGVEEDYTVLDR